MESFVGKSTSKDVFGKVYKGSVVDAYNRFTQPSIPSKTDAILPQPVKKEGFGCSAIRFSASSARLPGPGHYSAETFDNPSVSKKGFGGLTNSAPRFKKFQYVTSNPGPGSYTQKPKPLQGFIISQGQTKSLKKPDPLPAPGQYDPNLPQSTKELTSVFKSKSKRMEVPEKISPAPWQYTPRYELTKSSSSQLSSAFKTSVNIKRSEVEIIDIGVKNGVTPGPGEYYRPTKVETERPSSMFVSGLKDRFGNSSQPRVLNEMPGPGYYAQQEQTEKAPVTGAVFMSESERKWMVINNKPPGPAFYKPIVQLKKKSFHLKPDKLWV